MPQQSILILFAHPAYQKSRANRHLVDIVSDIESVTFHDLYEEYPDYDVDVRREQQLLVDHDIIVPRSAESKTRSFSVNSGCSEGTHPVMTRTSAGARKITVVRIDVSSDAGVNTSTQGRSVVTRPRFWRYLSVIIESARCGSLWTPQRIDEGAQTADVLHQSVHFHLPRLSGCSVGMASVFIPGMIGIL